MGSERPFSIACALYSTLLVEYLSPFPIRGEGWGLAFPHNVKSQKI
jgi:hypothetical protein